MSKTGKETISLVHSVLKVCKHSNCQLTLIQITFKPLVSMEEIQISKHRAQTPLRLIAIFFKSLLPERAQLHLVLAGETCFTSQNLVKWPNAFILFCFISTRKWSPSWCSADRGSE